MHWLTGSCYSPLPCIHGLINHLQLRPTPTSPAAKARDLGDLGTTNSLFFFPVCLLSFLFSFFPYHGALVCLFPVVSLGVMVLIWSFHCVCVLDDCS